MVTRRETHFFAFKSLKYERRGRETEKRHSVFCDVDADTFEAPLISYLAKCFISKIRVTTLQPKITKLIIHPFGEKNDAPLGTEASFRIFKPTKQLGKISRRMRQPNS